MTFILVGSLGFIDDDSFAQTEAFGDGGMMYSGYYAVPIGYNRDSRDGVGGGYYSGYGAGSLGSLDGSGASYRVQALV